MMKQVTLQVEGMSCGHCETTVKKTLQSLPGVVEVAVSLASKTVDVQYEEKDVTMEQMKELIEDQGYDVK